MEVDGKEDREDYYSGGISKETVETPAYQAELKKLQKHYGIRVTLNSFEQAAWDKEGAWARLDPCYELWLRVEAAKDIIGAEFAMKVHRQLAAGATAEEIITSLGRFEDHIEKQFPPGMVSLFWGSQITGVLRRTKRRWWFEY